MIDLVDRISDSLSEEMARLGWPPLASLPNGNPGRIVVGDSHQFGQLVPPCVFFRPIKGVFGSRNTSRGANPTGPSARSGAGSATRPYDAESRAAIANPAIWSEAVGFEVCCRSMCPVNEDVDPRAPELDYDFTRGLYTTLIGSVEQIASGCYQVENGTWSQFRHTQRVLRQFIFTLTIGVPVLRLGLRPPTTSGWSPGQPDAMAPDAPIPEGGVQSPGSKFAPSGVKPLIEDAMTTPSGQSEPGCEDDE